jgi:hypothetical protein
MKKIKFLIVLVAISFVASSFIAKAQLDAKEQTMIDALESLDNDIVKYFPRWKICEPTLQIHIFESFKEAGFDVSALNMSDIEVLAAPGDFDTEYGYYQILLISCGDAAMAPYRLSVHLTSRLRKEISGEYSYSGSGYGRTYCYKDIPPEIPVSNYQAEAIINYMQPSDVKHAFSLSLFEQNLKLGSTGFWLKSSLGNDPVGYQFWSSGEANIVLQRPLYLNKNVNTSRAIPYLIDFSLGAGYRIASGISGNNSIFTWLSDRTLNGPQNGSFIAGLNIHLPVMPELGLSMNAHIPFQALQTAAIEEEKWGKIAIEDLYKLDAEREDEGIYLADGTSPSHVVPVVQASGKVSLFYNWWMNKKNPENYLRADLGIAYAEVREMGVYDNAENPEEKMVSVDNIEGLKTYKSEGLDWLYFKLEYRNQATWPFGISAQISNQTFLGNIWVPIFGDWLLLEMKYSTLLRDPRPYELKNFLMFSPVIRITI